MDEYNEFFKPCPYYYYALRPIPNYRMEIQASFQGLIPVPVIEGTNRYVEESEENKVISVMQNHTFYGKNKF